MSQEQEQEVYGKGMNRTTEDDVLMEAFNLFDKDGSGSISTEEFGTAARAIGYNPHDSEIEALLQKYDTNGSKRLEFGEFKRLITELKKKPNNQHDIEKAFATFDHDGNGFIEASELKAILNRCGQVLSDEEVQEMINVADIDADGRINYAEFAKFICKPIS